MVANKSVDNTMHFIPKSYTSLFRRSIDRAEADLDPNDKSYRAAGENHELTKVSVSKQDKQDCSKLKPHDLDQHSEEHAIREVRS